MSSLEFRTESAVMVLFGRDTVKSAESRPAGLGGTGHPAALVRLRLVLLSFLMLFVELALIRWLGANIVYLSYYSNFVLLGSCLGIGIGFLRARSRVNLFPLARSRSRCLCCSCCGSRFRSATHRASS